MIRPVLRRPLLSSAAALAVISAVSAGVATTSSDPAQGAPTAAPVRPSAESTPSPSVQNARLAANHRAAHLARANHRKAVARKAAHDKAVAKRRVERQRVSRAHERAKLAAMDPRTIARAMLGRHGWSSAQFTCLDSLWAKESRWDLTARNSSSGAFGIPQALPGSKMASAGADWRTNPVTQISWGLDYIAATYGSPCSAWGHSRASGWY